MHSHGGIAGRVERVQDLTVTLTTERDENEIEFTEDPREPSAVNVESFVDEQGMDSVPVHQHLERGDSGID